MLDLCFILLGIDTMLVDSLYIASMMPHLLSCHLSLIT